MTEKIFHLSGGCHCGAVRYTISAPPLSVQHCHCETCRKTSGTLYRTGGVMRREEVVIEGAENLTGYRTSPSFEEHFCSICGCNLFGYDDDETNLFYVELPTLDGGVNPGHPQEMESHIYMGSRAEWEHVSDAIPQYEKEGPGEIITEFQKAET